MISDITFITPQTTYGELQTFLTSGHQLKAIPVVENKNSMILLGSSSRKRLIESLNKKVGVKARQAEALFRIKESFEEMEQRLKPHNMTKNNSMVDIEAGNQNNLPDKMQFYYTDTPDPKSIDEIDARKLSRL